MPAYQHEVELARDEGVEIRFLTSPIGFAGTAASKAFAEQYVTERVRRQ